jgi:hypothetical protein
MKSKDLMPFGLCGLLVLLFFFSSSEPVPAQDNTTLVVFSRHTFRGISKNVGPQKISLPQYGIDIPIPTLSYGQDATPQGLIIAEQFAGPGLQEAAALAVAAINENRVFDGHWDEVRAELAAERTFWTALYLRKGIQENDPQHNPAIRFTGCKTVSGTPVDAVSSDQPVKGCVTNQYFDVYLDLLRNSPDLPKLQVTFQAFLNTVRRAIGLNRPVVIPPPVYDDNGSLPKEYEQLAALASIIEMIADLGPPLRQIFPSSPGGPLLQFGKIALQQGVDSLGIRFFTSEPSPLSDAVSVFPVNYMMSRRSGSHTIVVSHDNMMSALMSSLGIITSNSAPDDWAFFPIESYVFAFGRSNVSIVRMRVQIRDPDGAIPGNYASQVVWTGRLAEWNEKVQALERRAGTLRVTCRPPITKCTAEEIDVAFYSTSDN